MTVWPAMWLLPQDPKLLLKLLEFYDWLQPFVTEWLFGLLRQRQPHGV